MITPRRSSEQGATPADPRPDDRRVVVTGMGAVTAVTAVTPLGNSVPDFWRALLAGEPGAAPITRFDPAGFDARAVRIRAVTVASGPLRAEGRALHVGGRVATAEGRITDAAGRLLVHGRESCLRMDITREGTR